MIGTICVSNVVGHLEGKSASSIALNIKGKQTTSKRSILG
jgi:hypothetical protein